MVRVEGQVHEARVLQAVREAFEVAVRDLFRSAIQRDGRGFLKTIEK